MSTNDDVTEFIRRELVAIFDESGLPVALETTEKKRLELLEEDFVAAIREGRHPLATLLEIRKIYQGKKGKADGRL